MGWLGLHARICDPDHNNRLSGTPFTLYDHPTQVVMAILVVVDIERVEGRDHCNRFGLKYGAFSVNPGSDKMAFIDTSMPKLIVEFRYSRSGCLMIYHGNFRGKLPACVIQRW